MEENKVCPSCGYISKWKYNSEYQEEFIEGDEKFIKIFTQSDIVINNPVEITPGDYDYEPLIKVYLRACPKCKTVILDV